MTVSSTEYNVYRGLTYPINPKEQEPESIQPNVVFRASRLGQVHAKATAFLHKTGELRSSAPVAFSSKRPDKAGFSVVQHNNGVAPASADLDARYAQLGAEIDSLELRPVSMPEKRLTASSTVTAPAGLSRVDALKGLWRCSSPASFFATVPNGDALRQEQESAAWQNPAAVEEAMKRNPNVDYIGGRCVKTDLSQFPIIDLDSYKKQCEIDMSVEEIVKKCLTRKPLGTEIDSLALRPVVVSPQPQAQQVLTFPDEKRLMHCLENHPVFGSTADYLREKKVFAGTAEHFADSSFKEQEVMRELKRAVTDSVTMALSLKAALEGCTQEEILEKEAQVPSHRGPEPLDSVHRKVFTFPRADRLKHCLRNHPVFRNRPDYYSSRNAYTLRNRANYFEAMHIFNAMAMVFDKATAEDQKTIRVRLATAVLYGSLDNSCQASEHELSKCVTLLQTALEGCTQDQIPWLDRLADRIKELVE